MKWIVAVNGEEPKFKTIFVCSRHFLDSARGKFRLKVGAVPSLVHNAVQNQVPIDTIQSQNQSRVENEEVCSTHVQSNQVAIDTEFKHQVRVENEDVCSTHVESIDDSSLLKSTNEEACYNQVECNQVGISNEFKTPVHAENVESCFTQVVSIENSVLLNPANQEACSIQAASIDSSKSTIITHDERISTFDDLFNSCSSTVVDTNNEQTFSIEREAQAKSKDLVLPKLKTIQLFYSVDSESSWIVMGGLVSAHR
ncbi:DNA transposase [Frankliniella fusca]|uniref:DNA transposase n=1 Tax=Frankliniella fusca TaxID=407009 RepID=A0AAE1LE45_9NEOP|nr:DNA transposase [Frankliniella fusca]